MAPTSTFRAMQAMAKTTTSVAEVVPSPMTCISVGSRASPIAAMKSGA